MTVQMLSVDMPVGQIVLEHPQTRLLLEKLRIDYPCSGDRSLRQAALDAGIDPDSILSQLESTLSPVPSAAAVMQQLSLTELCCWLVNVHHARLKEQMPNLDCLLCRVRKTPAKPYAVMLKRLSDAFESLSTDLFIHLRRQEQDVFPLITRFEAVASGGVEPAEINAIDLENAITAQARLHANTSEGLLTIRDLTEDYSWLDADNPAFCALYRNLAAFEDSLHEHIHYENNLLFPKALTLAAPGTI